VTTANSNLGVSVSNLPPVLSLVGTDSLIVLSNTTGTPSVRIIQFGTLCANLVLTSYTPVNSNAPGLPGMVSYDGFYFYVCTPTGWLRTSLSSF
jgi:hypothetical protein